MAFDSMSDLRTKGLYTCLDLFNSFTFIIFVCLFCGPPEFWILAF